MFKYLISNTILKYTIFNNAEPSLFFLKYKFMKMGTIFCTHEMKNREGMSSIGTF